MQKKGAVGGKLLLVVSLVAIPVIQSAAGECEFPRRSDVARLTIGQLFYLCKETQRQIEVNEYTVNLADERGLDAKKYIDGVRKCNDAKFEYVRIMGENYPDFHSRSIELCQNGDYIQLVAAYELTKCENTPIAEISYMSKDELLALHTKTTNNIVGAGANGFSGVMAECRELLAKVARVLKKDYYSIDVPSN